MVLFDKEARRRELRRLSQFKRRANQTSAVSDERRNKESLRKRKLRAIQTPAQSQERRNKESLSQFKRRANKTSAQTEERLNTEKLRKRKSRANKAQERQHRRRSIHEINISKDANYLEYIPTNKKKISPSNNSVPKINNVNVKEPPIHPVTNTNRDQSRPRHLTTPGMIKRLDPICLDRTIGLHKYNDGRIFESFADVVRVTFDSNGCTNHVLYASNSSRNNHLKDAYQLWNEYEEELRRLLNTVPLEALIRDELAGGCYGEYIFAGI